MNLYATTTSERAMKGQGGNKKLNIDILIFDRNNPLYTIEVTPDKLIFRERGYSEPLLIRDHSDIKRQEEKGKNPKLIKCYQEHESGEYKGCSIPHYHEERGKHENWYACEKCGAHYTENENNPYPLHHCPQHRPKGKNQENECTHLFSTAIYEDKKLQGYRCNNCGKLQEVNPQYRKSTKGKQQKDECIDCKNYGLCDAHAKEAEL